MLTDLFFNRLIVFLLILSDQMPPMTEIPLIGVYYFRITLVVALSTSLSVLTSSLQHNAVYWKNKVPRLAEKVFLHHLASWLCLREFAPDDYQIILQWANTIIISPLEHQLAIRLRTWRAIPNTQKDHDSQQNQICKKMT